MQSLNQFQCIGNVGQDPTIRTVGNSKVANFSVATTRSWKVGDEWKEKTFWHRVAAWGRLAETIEKNVKKGDRVFVQGELEYGSYKNQQGVDIPTAEIVADKVMVLQKRSERSAAPVAAATSSAPSSNRPQDGGDGDDGDDLPF